MIVHESTNGFARPPNSRRFKLRVNPNLANPVVIKRAFGSSAKILQSIQTGGHHAAKIWQEGSKDCRTRDAQAKERNAQVGQKGHQESQEQEASDRHRTFRSSQKRRKGPQEKVENFFFFFS